MPDCVIPGCINSVWQHGDTCTECVALFKNMLRETDKRMTEQQIIERDQQVRAIYKGRGSK
jgi:hypothetical protein